MSDAKKEPDIKINTKFLICCTQSADKDRKCRLFLSHDETEHSVLILRPFPSASRHVSALDFCCPCICFKSLRFVSLHFKFMVFLISFSTSSFFSLKYKGNAASTRPAMTKLFLLAVSSVSSLKLFCALCTETYSVHTCEVLRFKWHRINNNNNNNNLMILIFFNNNSNNNELYWKH